MALEDFDDELRKEMYFQNKEILGLVGNLKDIPDKLNNLISSQNSMKENLENQIKQMQTKVDGLSTHMSEVENNLSSSQEALKTDIADIKSKIQTIETSQTETQKEIKSLQTSQTEMQKEIKNLQIAQSSTSEDLSYLTSKVTQIVDVKIPELEGKISTSGEKPWVLLYDKTSSDPNINLGAPNGLHYENYESCLSSKDFMPYNKLRIYFAPGISYLQTFEFDISETKLLDAYRNVFHCVSDTPVLHSSYVATITKNGKCTVSLGRIYRWYFSGTKLVRDTVEGEVYNSTHIAKMEVQI